MSTKHLEVIEANALILRKTIGTAELPNGDPLELSMGMAGDMLLKNERTGITYAMSWTALIKLAIEEGIES